MRAALCSPDGHQEAVSGGLPADLGCAPRRFQPLLSDVRDLVSTLAAEEARGDTAWTPERLRNVLARQLGGEGILVVANREPYIHQRDESGVVSVVHPASGLVTALEPVMRACSGTWIAHGSGNADYEDVDRRERDIGSAANAMAAALSMPAEEQEERMRSMRTLVSELNVYRWAGKMLLDGTRSRRRDRLATRLAARIGVVR